MSKTIDERVVEMRFDNKQFESNVSTTMSTLDKLKQSLKFTDSAKGFDSISKAAKSVDIESLGDSVDSVRVRFSALQVVAVTALQNITNSAINAGKHLLSSLTVDQITAGFTKYEQKTASVQTLMNATGKSIDEINGYLNQLMWYSDETSYGFTDMTSALATMASSGGDVEKLVPMIEGVANATGFAGKGAAEFSRIMQYAINQAYSLGHMQVQDWKSIEGATVNSKQLMETLIQAGEALGTIKKGQVTIENFRNSLADKWLTKEVMEQGFGAFAKVTEEIYKGVQDGTFESYADGLAQIGDSYGEVASRAAKSVQEAKTFTEAIEATKDAVSSSFMRMAEMIFGDYEHATELWTEVCSGLYEAFAKPLADFEEILSPALGSKWDQLVNKINEAGVSMDDFQEKAIDVLTKHGVPIQTLIKSYGSFEKVMTTSGVAGSYLGEILRSIADDATTATVESTDLTAELEKMQKVVDEVWRGDWGNGAARFEALTKAGYDAAEVQKLVDSTIDHHRLTLEELGSTQQESAKYTEEQIKALNDLADQANDTNSELGDLINNVRKPSGRELLIDTVRNAVIALATVLGSVKEAWRDVFPAKTSKDIYNILNAVHKLSQKLILNKDSVEKLKRSFSGLFSIVKLLSSIVSGALRTGLNIVSHLLGTVGSSILDVTANVGDAITEFSKWVEENEFITKAFDKLNAAIDKAFNYLDKIASFVKGVLANAFSVAGSAISNFVSTIKETEAFQKISSAISEGVKHIKDELNDLSNRIDNFDFSTLSDKFGSVVSFLSDLGNALGSSKIVSTIVDGIVGAFNKIKNIKLPEFSFEKFIKSLNAFTTFLESNNYTGIVGTITGSFEWIKSKFAYALEGFNNKAIQKFADFYLKNGDNIRSGFKKFKDVLTSFITNVYDSLNANIPYIVSMVEEFLILTILIKTLSIVDNLSDAFSSITGGFEQFGKAAKWRAIGEAFKGLAIAIGSFAACLYIVSKIPAEDSIRSLHILAGAIAVMGIVIGALMALSNKVTGTVNLVAVVGSLIGIAASMWILVTLLEKIDGMTFDNLGRSLRILFAILGSLILSIRIVGKAAGAGTIKSVAAIVTMLTALKMVLSILEEYAEFPWAKVSSALPKLMQMLIGLALVLRLATGGIKAGANTAGLAVTILAMVASLWLILKAVQELAAMDPAEMEQGIKGITRILRSITIMLGALSLANRGNVLQQGQRSANTFKGLAVALLAIAAAVYVFGKMDTPTLTQGGIAITVILGLMAVIASQVAKLKDLKTGKLLIATIGMVAVIAALGIVVKMLAKEGWANAVGSAAALSILLGTLAGVMYACSKIGEFSGTAWIAIGAIAVLGFVVAELAGILYLIKDINGANAMYQATALGLLLSVLAGVMYACSAVGAFAGTAWSAIVGIAALGVVVGMLAHILDAIKDVDGVHAIAQVGAISLLLGVMTGVLYACTLIGPVSVLALKGIGVVYLAIIALGVIVAAMGELANRCAGIEPALEKGVKVMGLIGEAIGSFIGGIGKGLVESISSTLPKLGEDIGAFMTNAQPFFDGVKNINDDVVSKVQIMADAMSALGSAGLKNSFANILSLGNSLPKMGEQLNGFITNASPFFDKISTISEDSVKGAKALADTVLAITKSDFISGLQDFLGLGGDGFTEFANQIAPLGDAIAAFSTKVAGVDVEAVNSSAQAGKALSELASSLPNQGGWAQTILGSKDLATFGTSLITFGQTIKSYSLEVSGIDVEAITSSAEGAQALSQVASSLPKQGGVAQTLLGSKDLATFGTSLITFGTTLKNYAQEVTGLDVGSITTSVGAAQSLSALANSLPKQGGWSKTLLGDKDLATFGTNLITFGQCLVDYSSKVTGLNVGSIAMSVTAAKSLNELALALPEKKIFDGKVTLSKFGSQISSLGEDMASFASSVTSVGDVTSVVSNLRSLGDFLSGLAGKDFSGVSSFKKALKDLGSISVSEIASGISNGAGEVTAAINGLMNSITTGITSAGSTISTAFSLIMTNVLMAVNARKQMFYTAGMTLGLRLAAGLMSQSTFVSAAVRILVQNGASTLMSYYSSFYSAGAYVAIGFGNGIRDNAWYAKQFAEKMAADAIEAAKKKLAEASPSKVFKEIGGYVAEGFAIGIERDTWMSNQASSDMAKSAITNVENTLATFNDAVSGKLNLQPTIRPVVDMSAAQVSSLDLGSNLDVSLTGHIDSLSQLITGAQTDIRNSNMEVISAINGLRDDLSAIGVSLEDRETALYVDSKKLASSLAKPMNRQLNILSQRGAYA